MLREVGKCIGVIDVLTDAMVDSRHPSYVRHGVWEMNAQHVRPANAFSMSGGRGAILFSEANKEAREMLLSER